MRNLQKKKLLDNIGLLIEQKLTRLRNSIWEQTDNIPLEDIEAYLDNLRVCYVLTTDLEIYPRLQLEIDNIGEHVNKVHNDKDLF